jgi:hypothetical protein
VALVRVFDERQVKSSTELFSYSVTAFDEAGGDWVPWCLSGARVVVLEGGWDERGGYREEAGATTLACLDGVLAKCILWGYPPWGADAGVPMRTLHQACTRMGRADYCGDGKSHTRDGTPIAFWDVAGVHDLPIPDGMSLEAVWSTQGAICVRRARWGETPSELVSECPRLAGHVGLDAGCEQALTTKPLERGAVLVSYSFNQKPDAGSALSLRDAGGDDSGQGVGFR